MKNPEPNNESSICRKIISLIGERRGETTSNAIPVDKLIRNSPAVEFRFETNSARFALEHTRLESFPCQISMGKQFCQLLEPLEGQFAGKLPGVFFLSCHAGAARAPANKHAKIRSALSKWISIHAPTLDADEDVDECNTCTVIAQPPGVPFQVALHRDASYGSELYIMQDAPGDREVLRRAAIRRAFDKKLPKLQKERNAGYNSVLVLESNDSAFTNRKRIAQTVVDELSTRSDAPDIIIWVRAIGSYWKAWFFKDGTGVWPNVEEAGPYDL